MQQFENVASNLNFVTGCPVDNIISSLMSNAGDEYNIHNNVQLISKSLFSKQKVEKRVKESDGMEDIRTTLYFFNRFWHSFNIFESFFLSQNYLYLFLIL